MDRLTSERRSWLMSRVRQKGSQPEIKVRRMAHAMGLRFRLHRPDLPGSPDLVFPRHKRVVFVHGCFWHRHQNCAKASNPKTRQDFWQAKFRRNVERDARVEEALRLDGWLVEVIWECQTHDIDALRAKIISFFS